MKELSLRPDAGSHDFAFKMAHARRFLTEGEWVRLRGPARLGQSPETPNAGAAGLLERAIEALHDVGRPWEPPTIEGRTADVVLAPLESR